VSGKTGKTGKTENDKRGCDGWLAVSSNVHDQPKVGHCPMDHPARFDAIIPVCECK
jgi:hypothetical protein